MWIFTRDGLFMPAAIPEGLSTRLNRHGVLDLQVRGRDAAHLARFRKRFFKNCFRDAAGRVMASAIEHTPEKDYQCRFYTTRAVFAQVLSQAILEIDYLKFKPAAGQTAGSEFEGALNRVWNVLAGEYGTWGSEGSIARRARPYGSTDFEQLPTIPRDEWEERLAARDRRDVTFGDEVL